MVLECFGGPACGLLGKASGRADGQRYTVRAKLSNGLIVTATYRVVDLEIGSGTLFERRRVLQWVPYPDRDDE